MKSRLGELAAPPVFVLLWSSAFIAGVIGVGAAPPMLLLFVRFGLSGMILLAYVLLVHAPLPRGRDLVHVAVAGVMIQAVQFGAFYSAMSYHVPASIIALIQGLNPVVIGLLATRVLDEKVDKRQWIAVVVGGVGVTLAVLDQADFSVAGLILCVVGLLGMSLGTVYQKRFSPSVDPRSSTAIHTLASAPVVGIIALAQGDTRIDDWGSFSEAIVWMVFVNSIGAFLLLNAMLRRSSATTVSKLFFATPAVTALMAWIVLGQDLRLQSIIGLAVGAAGMMVALIKPRSGKGEGASTDEQPPPTGDRVDELERSRQ